MNEEDSTITTKAPEESPAPRRPKRIKFPRRAPSIVVPKREIVYTTPDKTTCFECGCFPEEDPYVKRKKLNPCQKSPPTLYELAARIVDALPFPPALGWSEDDVVTWLEEVVGLPQYKECILDNHIDGKRLLMLEDPSKLPEINIHDYQHIKRIVSRIRLDYGLELIRFARSIALPARRPLALCTLFKGRTGPAWGGRENWTRCDILRLMKIINPSPVHRDHWDLVWYQKPDFPKTLFGRVKWEKSKPDIPVHKEVKDICAEYLVPRKFRIQRDIRDSQQYIWMEHRPGSSFFKIQEEETKKNKRKPKFLIKDDSTLLPKKIDLKGLKGKDLILARRVMPKPKFLDIPIVPVVNI